MKKIMLFLVFLSLTTFGKMTISPSRLEERVEVIGNKSQLVKLETSQIRLTGFWNSKLYYKIDLYDNYFRSSNNSTAWNIEIKELYLDNVNGNHNKDERVISGVSGNTSFRVKALVSIKGDRNLSGEFRSAPITIIFNDEKGNKVDEARIEIAFKTSIIKDLKVDVQNHIDLGTIVKGTTATTKNGSSGLLSIDGEPNKTIKIKYSDIVELSHRDTKEILQTYIKTPELIKEGDEYKAEIRANGKLNVVFEAEIKDTRGAADGEYFGSFVVKVRYD